VELYLKVRLACRDGMSGREAARHFGISHESVKKMLSFSVPPGYRRTAPIKRPKLDGFTEIIDQWLRDDVGQHRKQRHTAKRVFDRLRDEHGFTGGYTIVKDYVRDQLRRRREMFVPLHHAPGHAQADFGEALVVIGGSSRKPTSSRSICRIATRVTFGPIQRQRQRLGSTATFMLLLSSAECRCRCFTTTTDAW
jgi:transposase